MSLITLLWMNLETRLISLALFVPPVLGAVLYTMGVSGVAYPLVIAYSFFLGRKYLPVFFRDFRAVSGFFILMAWLLVAFLYGPQHSYSLQKLTSVFVFGVVGVFIWSIIYRTVNIQWERITALVVFLCLTYIFLSFDFWGFNRPTGLQDFDFFRLSYVRSQRDQLPFTYHSVGVPAMIALACLLLPKERQITRGQYILLAVGLIWILILTQARQAIVGAVLIGSLRLWIAPSIGLKKKIGSIVLIIGGFVVLLATINSTAYQQAITADTVTGLINRDFSRAWELIHESPVLGAGLGGYSTDAHRSYPHNLFLEVLSELGLIGFMLLIFSVFYYPIQSLARLVRMQVHGCFIIIFLFAYFIRSMISGDLTESIFFLVGLMYTSHYLVNRLTLQTSSK